MSLTLGPFLAGITTMGPVKGVLIPKKYRDDPKFKKLINIKKHKITIKIEPVD